MILYIESDQTYAAESLPAPFEKFTIFFYLLFLLPLHS